MAGRGPSWRRAEVLDLLGIWGEAKVQASLKESHRNIDVFEDVAEEMRRRGHKKSAEECRSKTKSMRMAYKRALGHNNKTGNERASCPFFDELDSILKGDATVKIRPTKQSNPRVVEDVREVDLQGTIDLFPMNMEERIPESELQDLLQSDAPSDDHGSQEQSSTVDSDETRITQNTTHDKNTDSATTVLEAARTTGIQKRNPDDIPPGVPLSQLSPSSRIALKRKRRERVSATQRVGEQMMSRSTRNHQELIGAISSATDKLTTELRVTREAEMHGTETVCSLFREAIVAIKGQDREDVHNREIANIGGVGHHVPRTYSSGPVNRGWDNMGDHHAVPWGGQHSRDYNDFNGVPNYGLSDWGDNPPAFSGPLMASTAYNDGPGRGNMGRGFIHQDHVPMQAPPNFPPANVAQSNFAREAIQNDQSSELTQSGQNEQEDLERGDSSRVRPKRQIKPKKLFSP